MSIPVSTEMRDSMWQCHEPTRHLYTTAQTVDQQKREIQKTLLQVAQYMDAAETHSGGQN